MQHQSKRGSLSVLNLVRWFASQVDAEELRAELPTLHPSEAVFARRQAGHLIEQADADTDKHLTLAEMLANPVRGATANATVANCDGGGFGQGIIHTAVS